RTPHRPPSSINQKAYSLNARQKRLFEADRKKNPELKIPQESQLATAWTEDDQALIKQGVGDKSSRPAQGQSGGEGGSEATGEHAGAVVTYFEDKGFGFLRPD